MPNIIPELINDYRIYVNGSTDLKGTGTLQLPSIERLTETIKGAGIAGEIETDIMGHFKSMKLTINWRMVTEELHEFLSPSRLSVDCRIVNQEFDVTSGERELVPNKVYVMGKCLKTDLGKVESGSPYDSSSEIEIDYMKVERNGETLLEIDKYNYIYVVNGVDHMKQLRDALGMN